MYYKICEYCGAYLDTGERCDCKIETSQLESKNRRAIAGATQDHKRAKTERSVNNVISA